jgi:hypothetical protein
MVKWCCGGRKEIVESESGEDERQDSGTFPAIKRAHHDGYKETGGRTVDWQGDGQREGTSRYREAIASGLRQDVDS